MIPVDRFKAALASLSPALASAALGALSDVAGAAADSARRRLTPGPLADSIAVVSDPDSGTVMVEVADPHATFVEYDTARTPARPFLRPAAEAAAHDGSAIVGGALANGLQASLKDLA